MDDPRDPFDRAEEIDTEEADDIWQERQPRRQPRRSRPEPNPYDLPEDIDDDVLTVHDPTFYHD